MDEKEENKDKKNEVNEPAAEYAKQEITFFKSFEEMNEAQYKYWAGLTPEQRLTDHYNLIIQIYKDELEKIKNITSDKIIFRDTINFRAYMVGEKE